MTNNVCKWLRTQYVQQSYMLSQAHLNNNSRIDACLVKAISKQHWITNLSKMLQKSTAYLRGCRKIDGKTTLVA